MKLFVMILVVALTLSFSAGAATAGSPFKELCLKAMGMSEKSAKKESTAKPAKSAARKKARAKKRAAEEVK